MEGEIKAFIALKPKQKRKKDKRRIKILKRKNYNYQNKKLYFFISIMILIFFVIIYFILDYKKEFKSQSNQINNYLFKNKAKENIMNLKNKINMIESKLNISNQNLNIENSNNNINLSAAELLEITFEKFDENIFQELKNQQIEFCNNQTKYIKEEYEKQIKLAKIDLLNKSFYMYIYQKEDYVSNYIIKEKNWEGKDTKNLIDALNYYSSVKNIKNDNIFILDIGANIGWHSIFLGKYGYQILSFEPSDINIYILRKNYCLNPNLNVIFIKKGLYNEEKKCEHYILTGNIGNGMTICDNSNVTLPYYLRKRGETYMTKLSNFIEFLSTKNLALIKIDVEGSEEKAIESGIELITKYHVPFIFLEFTPESLRIHRTNPMKFLEMFENNGYKFPKHNFFDNKYYTKQELVGKCLINLYIVYSDIIKNV